MKVSDLQLMQSIEYTGTIKSLQNLVKNLNLKKEMYIFNIQNKYVYLNSGLILRPGDFYSYPYKKDG